MRLPKWLEVIKYVHRGSPRPMRRVEKPDAVWKRILSPEQYRITRQGGTERAFSGKIQNSTEPALYRCVCCGNPLFDARHTFDSGTGWPSFTEPVTFNTLRYRKDLSHGMRRIEVLCNVCDAHLGHVFQDGPRPGELRYCINSPALKKAAPGAIGVATLGGGCFWCTEALFQSLKGVISLRPGYSGGKAEDARYTHVKTGSTGHAEVVQLVFETEVLSYEALLHIHLLTHDPTTPDRQGADIGPQYRSVIFYHDEAQRQTAEAVIRSLQPQFSAPIITELTACTGFYPAEDIHTEFYLRNQTHPYCAQVISPKLDRLRERFSASLKAGA